MTCTEEQFKEYFQPYGGISKVELHALRGFGYITYESPDCVDACLEKYEEHYLGKKWVEVKRSIPRELIDAYEREQRRLQNEQNAAMGIANGSPPHAAPTMPASPSVSKKGEGTPTATPKVGFPAPGGAWPGLGPPPAAGPGRGPRPGGVPGPGAPGPGSGEPAGSVVKGHMAQLQDMGFSAEAAKKALAACAWDVNNALDWLLTNGEPMGESGPPDLADPGPTPGEVAATPTSKAAPPPPPPPKAATPTEKPAESEAPPAKARATPAATPVATPVATPAATPTAKSSATSNGYPGMGIEDPPLPAAGGKAWPAAGKPSEGRPEPRGVWGAGAPAAGSVWGGGAPASVRSPVLKPAAAPAKGGSPPLMREGGPVAGAAVSQGPPAAPPPPPPPEEVDTAQQEAEAARKKAEEEQKAKEAFEAARKEAEAARKAKEAEAARKAAEAARNAEEERLAKEAAKAAEAARKAEEAAAAAAEIARQTSEASAVEQPRKRLERAARSWPAEEASQLGVTEGEFIKVWSDTTTEHGWIHAENLDASQVGWLPLVVLRELPDGQVWMKAKEVWKAMDESQCSVEVEDAVIVWVQTKTGEGWTYCECEKAAGVEAQQGWLPAFCLDWTAE